MTEQAEVADCIKLHFGEDSLTSEEERSTRFFEEAVELVQPFLERDKLVELIDYVYGRPLGTPYQEIGGVGVTLMGLAECLGFSCDEAISTEVKRFKSLPSDYFRRRHAAKFKAGISTINTEPTKTQE